MKNGIQLSFYNPKVLYDQNYISGLLSWSIRDNVQYNFTTTGNGLNITCFADSLYNQASHFNLYIRNCTLPYSYFNKVDQLCYTSCPTGTYQVTVYLTC